MVDGSRDHKLTTLTDRTPIRVVALQPATTAPGDQLDQTELRAEITRLHKLILDAAQQAKEQNVTVTLIDKLTSAQIRLELLLKKLRPTGKQ